MEKVLQNQLRPSETVLWNSRPAHFPLLEPGNRVRIIALWIIAVLLAGGFIAAYCTQNAAWNPKYVIIMAGTAVLVMLSPLVEYARVQREQFCLTTERAILIMGSKVFSMELAAIDTYKVIRGVTAHDCLALGSSIMEYVRKETRWRACHPKVNMQDSEYRGRIDGMVFYNVADAAPAIDILNRRNGQTAA